MSYDDTMRVLGLDISTTCVGVAIVTDEATTLNHVPGTIYAERLDHIDFKAGSTFWDKVDTVKAYLDNLSGYKGVFKFDDVAVEEALMSFRPGMSSAQTISTLVAFNAIVRHLLRQQFCIDPTEIASSTARKLAGVKVIPKTKCGKDAKTQVFEYMCVNDLSHIVWPRKKPTKKNPVPDVKDFAKDTVDAYVVAKAALLLKR
jgi:hypothetical protein